MLFIRPDKVRQIHSALITLSALRGRQAMPKSICQVFVVQNMCLLFTLRPVSCVPAAGTTSGKLVSAVAFLLRVFYGIPHPTAILLREKGSFIHSLMACQAAALYIRSRAPMWTRQAHAPGPWPSHISVQNICGGSAELRKRRFWTPRQAHCVKNWAQGPCMAWGSTFLCISSSALQVIQGPHFRKPSSKCF